MGASRLAPATGGFAFGFPRKTEKGVRSHTSRGLTPVTQFEGVPKGLG